MFSLKQQHLISLLKTIDYLKALPFSALEKLASQGEMTYLNSGDTLIHQGDKGDCLYIVQSGFLRAIKEQPGKDDEIIGDIRRGELIGELALFTSSPRAATVIAIRDSILWKLSGSSFELFVQENIDQVMPMVKSVILRILNPKKSDTNPYVTLALAPAGQSSLLDQPIIHTIVDQLKTFNQARPSHRGRSHASTLHLHSAMMKTQFPEINWQHVTPEVLFQSNVIDWLNEQEETHQYVIYETDNIYSPWTALCLRQADKIILIGESHDAPTLGVIEQHVFRSSRKTRAPITLILLHDPNTVMPRDTAHWLVERHVDVLHVKKGILKDIQRVVRLISGEGIVLVLGGGGAKGCAHLGVYKAFCELGVPIDRVCGTSMGSIMAAFIAMDLPLHEIVERINQHAIHNKKLNGYTLPFVSLLSGVGWLDALKNLYGESLCIEDLWKNFFCITSNFTMRKMEVLKQGLLYLAIRASVSLPGIVPPISNARNELLIDGGIFNNVPVDVMRNIASPCKIVAIRVSPYTRIHSHLPGGVFSGFKHYFNKFKASRAPHANIAAGMPNVSEIIMGALTLCNDEQEMRMLADADYALDIDLSPFGMLEFDKMPELIELGYQAAMDKFSKAPWNQLIPRE